MRRLISFFDYSGQWSQPYLDAGWDVIRWDIKLSEFMDIMLLNSAETVLDMFEDCDGALFAPPCTHFTNSGAQYWPMKDLDGRTSEAIEYINQALRLVDLFTPTDPDYEGSFFWSLENPVGRLSKLVPELGRPTYFQPWQFAGYLNPTTEVLDELDRIRLKNGFGVTNEEIDFVVTWNAYNKKTGLWGCFNDKLLPMPIEPVRCTPQGTFTQKYGGNSEYTKEMRSNTPAGFAKAFYSANR